MFIFYNYQMAIFTLALEKYFKTGSGKAVVMKRFFKNNRQIRFKLLHLSGVASSVATNPYFYRIVDIVDFLETN
jgi:hypothetical protein